MKAKRKSRGYWDDFTNVERELRAFVDNNDVPGKMPTSRGLNAAGRNDLVRAIGKHGGFPAIAVQLGLEQSYDAKPYGYWDDFANLERELRTFITEHGTDGIMPKGSELDKAGRIDLHNVIRKHGGFPDVAKRLGLSRPGANQPAGYWANFENLEQELLSFIEVHGMPGIMPTYTELEATGQHDLQNALGKHGGIPIIAERLGLKRTDAGLSIAGTSSVASAIQFGLVCFQMSQAHLGELGNTTVCQKLDEVTKVLLVTAAGERRELLCRHTLNDKQPHCLL